MTVWVSGGGAPPDAATGHALELLHSALDVVELLVTHVIEPGRAEQEGFTKEVGEIAMLLRLADRVLTGDADRQRIVDLAGRIASLARSPEHRGVIVRRPSRAAAHLLAHACLQQLGCTDPAFDELARAALAASAAGASERVPYRLLDVAWIRHLLLGDGELDHPALALSPIAQGVDLVGATTEDAYAFSHALPYATDFGRHPLPGWADTRWLAGIADALVLKALDEDDLDLLGELLMVPALLRRPWSPVQWFGWRVLCDTWRYYGFVPGPGLPAATAVESTAQTRRRVLGTVYHTTLVGGLLVATLHSCGYWPPAEPPVSTGRVLPPVGGVDPADTALVWQRVWHRLDAHERADLAAVPEGMALHRALARTDVAAMLHSLRNTRALLPEPLVSQSAELLNRLAIVVGA
jgi:hypothetical protein